MFYLIDSMFFILRLGVKEVVGSLVCVCVGLKVIDAAERRW